MKNFYIALVGCANVGKSTLMNRLSNSKISIVSSMAQTTRNAIPNFIKKENSNWLIFDTPGILNPKNKLDLFLINEAFDQIKKAKIIILLIDSSKSFNEQIKTISEHLNRPQNLEKKLILIYTKIDLNKNLNELKNEVNNNFKKIDKTFLFNLLNDDLSELINEIETSNTNVEELDNNLYFDEIMQDNFLIKELIREQIIKHTFQEIPHASAVIIENKNYDEIKNIFHIHCSIVVEKDSQKAIIIGKNASKIKEIGIAARKELNNIYDCKINLKLFCKVEKDWRNNNYLIKDFGYKKWQK